MSTNCLKLFALLFMIIDHIGEFFINSPFWFRYIGRLSVPLYFFCSAWGLAFTHNKKLYIFRMYFLSIFMAIGNIVISYIYNININNNIYSTLFIGTLTVVLLEQEKKLVKRLLLLGGYQLLVLGICVFLAEIIGFPFGINLKVLYQFYGSILGSCIFCEGSILFVIYYCLMYWLKNKVWKLSIFTIIFSGVITLLANQYQYYRGIVGYMVPFFHYQGLMCLAIPFFFMFNMKKGINMKYFYYIFYPVHIWFLSVLSYYTN